VQPVSAKFLAGLRSATMVTRLDVLADGEVIHPGIAVNGGTLVRNRKQAQCAQLSCVVADPELAPTTPASDLGPAGFEVTLWRGLRFSDGTEELVQMFTGPIQDANVDWVDLTTSVEAVDRSQRVIDASLERDKHIAPGSDTGLSAIALVQDVIPDVMFDIAGVSFEPSGRLVWAAQSDPWKINRDVFKAVGAEICFDGAGALMGRPEPDVRTTDPVWVVNEGDSGVLITGETLWSRRPTFNRAIVTGTNTEFGVTYRGVATDSAPSSPSAYASRFGPKPLFFASPHVTSTASATAAAAALLRSKQGVAMSLDFSAVTNPALVPGDVITVQRSALDLNMPVVIDAITVGLAPDAPMTCQVRARQEEDIEV